VRDSPVPSGVRGVSGEFERHAIDVDGMDAERAAAVVSSRLAAGTLDL